MAKSLAVVKPHADLGASKAERWMNCPGSVAAEADLPDTSTRYAREGTAAHEVAKNCLQRGVPASSFLGMMVLVEGEYIEVTEEMTEGVQVYVDYVRSVEAAGKAHVLWVEHKFDLASLNPPGPMYGTADAVVWAPSSRELEIIDFKYGAGVAVDARENDQLMYYCLGAILALKKMPARIRATIVQPRAHHPQGIVRTYEFTFEVLVDWKEGLFNAAAKTLQPNAPRQVGTWCRFCKAAAVCPAQRDHAVAVAQSEFDVLAPELPAPASLSSEQLSFVLAHAPQVEDWFRAVERWVSDEIAAGRPVTGWKLVPKRANRKWKDEDAAKGALRRMGVPQRAMFVQKFVSPAQAEKLLKEVDEELPADLYTKESSGSNLVPDTDPRPALLSGPAQAQNEFGIEPRS